MPPIKRLLQSNNLSMQKLASLAIAEFSVFRYIYGTAFIEITKNITNKPSVC